MKKIGIFSLIIVTTLFLISCASVPKIGFNREKMNVCNMMGYSNDALAIKFAKEIWNDKVDVVSLEENQGFVIAYDIRIHLQSLLIQKRKVWITAQNWPH